MGRFDLRLVQPKVCLRQRTVGAMHFFLNTLTGLFAIFVFGLILIYDHTECIHL